MNVALQEGNDNIVLSEQLANSESDRGADVSQALIATNVTPKIRVKDE